MDVYLHPSTRLPSLTACVAVRDLIGYRWDLPSFSPPSWSSGYCIVVNERDTINYPYIFAFEQIQVIRGEGRPLLGAPLQLRLEPPTGVFVTQECILTHTLQSIISFSSISTFILLLHDIP